MAFGGVATGSIKAGDIETVAGIITRYGLILKNKERLAKIGINRVVVAVFDVISVKNIDTALTMNIIKKI